MYFFMGSMICTLINLEDYHSLKTFDFFFHCFRRRIAEKENLALLNLKESVSLNLELDVGWLGLVRFLCKV